MTIVRHVNNRRIGVIALALLCAVALSGCRREVTTQEHRTLRYLTWTSVGQFSNDLIARVGHALPGTQVETEHTSGSLVVLSYLQHGKGDFGFSLADVAYTAYRRGIEPELFPHTNLRAIAVRWVNAVYVVVPQASDIRRVEDLKGKRVGVVPQGSAGELLSGMILEAHHLTYADVKPRFIPVDQLIPALQAGELDAIMPSATPVSDFAELRQSRLRVVPLGKDAIKELQGQFPFVKTVTLERDGLGPTGTMTVGVDSVLVCRADLDDRTAYELTKAFYGLLSDAAKTQPGIDPENASATPIPLHPGAARFYREQEVLNES